jgi:hypothetical protein
MRSDSVELIQRIARAIRNSLTVGLVAAFMLPGTAFSQSPAPLDLGCSGTFAVLAGSTVTSTGATIVDGNIGLSPGSGIVGFPPATVVNGAIHINDALAISGKSCLTIAYNDAAGRTPVPTGTFLNPGSGNIGGLTLVAGLYKFTSSAAITGSNVTLSGGANDIWIFQIASDLNVGNGVQVILAGGAQAKNVFWQVGTSATIGTSAIMKGTILADQSISLNTGAVLDGRAMARIGAVTLAGNTINKPPIDSTFPSVISMIPVGGAIRVPVNQTLSATFSEIMNQATITDTTFFLRQGVNPISGVVSYNGLVASFNPTIDLLYNTLYTATITTGVRDLDGYAIARNFVWQFRTIASMDTLAPTVISTIPMNGANAVPGNQKITATFDEIMDSLTLTTSSFIVMAGATPVAGTVSYVGVTATFTPTNPLVNNTMYTARITNAVKDSAGNAMANDYVWYFNTGPEFDLISPTVHFTVPGINDANVPVNQRLAVTFSEAMDPATITGVSFMVRNGPLVVTGSVVYRGLTATFTPDFHLLPNATYTATITTAVRDLAGNKMLQDFIWTFDTDLLIDLTSPIVISTDPVLAGMSVNLNKMLSVTFSKEMDPLTFTSSSFTLHRGTMQVGGLITSVGADAFFTPFMLLSPNTVYTATITTDVTDLSGNQLAMNYSWGFTTGGALPGQLAIDLGCANSFTILAGSTVTSTGNTIINGDLGLSPGSTVVGFPPGQVLNGSIHINDVLANNAKLCLTTAYNDAAGRTLNAIVVSDGELGGKTLAPGLYRSAPGSFGITNSDLTLDAQGNAQAMWIFQMPSSTLTVGNGRKVILSGGANANNIFWQIGTSATIGTTAEMKGILMADQSITLNTGAVLDGRALARIGAVTFSGNMVNNPSIDSTFPSVISTIPMGGATRVAINQNVSATFSENMNQATITDTTFTLKQGVHAVAGVVSYNGLVATFNPTSDLLYNTLYTATITTSARDLDGNAIARNFVWQFRTTTSMDTLAPTVISTMPMSGANAVPGNQKITATFDEIMNPLTITSSSFIVMAGSTPVAGTVSYVGVTATFTPTSPLLNNTIYTARITNAVRDSAGIAMVNDYVWHFYTGPQPDMTSPTVSFTVPGSNDANVPVNQRLAATFSEAMDPSTISNMSFTLKMGTQTVPGSVIYRGQTATFTPDYNLMPNVRYTATISTAVTDLAGNPMLQDYVWSFDTDLSIDLTAPVVISTQPVNAESSVILNKTLSVTFSKEMDPFTFTSTSFTLRRGSMQVGGLITSIGADAFFTPFMLLSANTVYTATITTQVTDLAGNALEENYSWNFTTGNALPGPLTIDLDCANSFTILAGSTITSTGNTVIHGDLGLSPGSIVAGFPPGQVLNGSVHINDALANSAKLCLTDAYNDAAGRTLNVIIVSDGELGGKTLAPGLYRSAPGSFGITNFDLTLDAQGDAQAIWIFQMPSSTLTVGNGRKVILAGGANARNIFWQIGTSATIGTTAEIKGILMADQSIALKNGAVLHGRALARTGAVTMDNNKAVRSDIVLAIADGLVPAEFTLSQNYPNPFNPVTQIDYGLANAGMVTLRIYNPLGLEVATLVNSYQEAGNHTVSFDANQANIKLQSGMYFYRLEAGSSVSMSRKLILLK